MLNKLARVILLFIAYLPLLILLFLKHMPTLIDVIIWSVVFLILGWVMGSSILYAVKKVHPHSKSATIEAEGNHEYLGFLLTYILPFVIDINGTRDFLSLGIIFLLIAYFYIQTSIFATNPLLKILFGYDIYKVRIDGKKSYLLTKKKHLIEKKDLKVVYLSHDVYVEEQR